MKDELNAQVHKKYLCGIILKRSTNIYTNLCAGILQYLHTGALNMDANYDDLFDIPSKNRIASFLRDLLTKLSPSGDEVNNYEDIAETEAMVVPSITKTPLKDELEQVLEGIGSRAHVGNLNCKASMLTTIKKEMGLFEAGGSRGHHLQKSYEYLQIIKPTSVESERAFSSAGYFCTKIRSRLNDETISGLCFLRSYFNEIRKNSIA